MIAGLILLNWGGMSREITTTPLGYLPGFSECSRLFVIKSAMRKFLGLFITGQANIGRRFPRINADLK